MDLYLIRHAEAEPLDSATMNRDADRPLTSTGREQARTVANCLQGRGVQLKFLLTSPLLRAEQTAEDILQQWPDPVPELRVCEELAPGGQRRKLAKVLARLEGDTVGLVGHVPDLTRFAGWLAGDRRCGIDLAKSGVALIRCENRPGKGEGRLVWLVTPDWMS